MMRKIWFQSLYWSDCVLPEMPNSCDSDWGQTSTVRTHKWRQACGTKHLGGHRRRKSKNCAGFVNECESEFSGERELGFKTVGFTTNVGSFLIQICKCQLYIFSLCVFIKDSFFKRLNTRILLLKMSKVTNVCV